MGSSLRIDDATLERLADQIRGRVLVAGGEYVNDQTDDDPERVNAASGENYDRFVSVTNEWGLENLFRMNQKLS